MERPAKLVILLGTNGTGKTTMLRKILAESGQRALIVTPDDIEWTDLPVNELTTKKDFEFDGMCRHIYNPEKTLDAIKFYKKGILVFDDCRSYFQNNTDPRVRDLLIRRRQRSVDVFAVGHGFTQVPPVFFTFASDYILFKTCDNIKMRKNCIVNYEFMARCQQHVNEQSKLDLHKYRHIKV